MRVLAVGCHPDDLEIACWGTLRKYVEQGAVLFTGQHIGELGTIPHQVTKLANISLRDKVGFDHAAHIQVTDPFSILSICFVTLLQLRIFRVRQCNLASLFENVEHGYPVLPCRLHTNVRTEVLREPSC